MLEAWRRNIRDATDILKRARNPAELAKGMVPNHWLRRRVLNEGSKTSKASPPTPNPTALASSLRALRSRLKAEMVSDSGRVDYAGLRESDAFVELRRTSQLLQDVDLSSLADDNARIAFWTNLYNVLAIHGVIELGIRESVMEIPSFFGTVSYVIGGFTVSLDEIENGILRRNAPHPATGTKPFREGDARLALLPSIVDPRIHAALVCASSSCPPVAFYDAEHLDSQLDLAARGYVAADVQVDESNQLVRMPITFRYYRQDFGNEEGIWDFLLRHAVDDQREAIDQAAKAGFTFAYHRYDWSLNSVV